MIRLNKRTYDRVVAELVYTSDIRKLFDKFSVDRIFYFNILKDISDGKRSRNYDLLKKVARKRKLSENFIIEQAKSVLNFYVPYFQVELNDYYKILNVRYDATDEEIRRSWIELMKSHHPDRVGPDGLDEAKRINEAYAVLGNMEKRDAYDQRYLPFIPVMVFDRSLGKNFYSGASVVLVVLIVVVYAAGSGLLFGSREEKEIFARKIEQPALPNIAYHGDPLESVISENEKAPLKTDEKEDSAPRVIAEGEITDSSSSRNESGKFESEEIGDDVDVIADISESSQDDTDKSSPEIITDVEDVIAEIPEPAGNEELAENIPGDQSGEPEIAESNTDSPELTENENDKLDSEVVAGDEDVIAEIPEPAETEELAENIPGDQLGEPAIAELKTEVETNGDSETVAAVDENEEPATETEEVDADNGLASVRSVQEPGEIDEPEQQKEREVAVLDKEVDKDEPPGGVRLYKVQSGDSLWIIARNFDTTTEELGRLNQLSGNKIKPGQELIISGAVLPASESGKESSREDEEPAAEVAVINKEADKDEPLGGVRLYKVQSGDSLSVIARKFGTTTAELNRLNQLSENKIRIGQELIISGPALSPVTALAEPGKKETAETKVYSALPAAVKDSPPQAPAETNEMVKDYDPALSVTAVSVRKQNIANPGRAAPEPDQRSLYNFVSEYASAYKSRDLGKIESLFAPDGVENGRSISTVINSYKSNFASLDIISYDIKVSTVNLREQTGYVRGDFYIKFKDHRTGAMKNSRGQINWQLHWKGGAWEITDLSYKIEKTDNING